MLEILELVIYPLGCYFPELFLYIMIFLASLFMIKHDDNNALSLYFSCLKICSKIQNFKYFPKILLSIGMILQRNKKYESALDCIVRGLEFTYFFDDKRFEVDIYDSLGKIFYERNQQDKALYYHNRAIKGMLEPYDSIKRQIAVKSVKDFMKLNQKGLEFDPNDSIELIDLVTDLHPTILKVGKPGKYNYIF